MRAGGNPFGAAFRDLVVDQFRRAHPRLGPAPARPRSALRPFHSCCASCCADGTPLPSTPSSTVTTTHPPHDAAPRLPIDLSFPAHLAGNDPSSHSHSPIIHRVSLKIVGVEGGKGRERQAAVAPAEAVIHLGRSGVRDPALPVHDKGVVVNSGPQGYEGGPNARCAFAQLILAAANSVKLPASSTRAASGSLQAELNVDARRSGDLRARHQPSRRGRGDYVLTAAEARRAQRAEPPARTPAANVSRSGCGCHSHSHPRRQVGTRRGAAGCLRGERAHHPRKRGPAPEQCTQRSE